MKWREVRKEGKGMVGRRKEGEKMGNGKEWRGRGEEKQGREERGRYKGAGKKVQGQLWGKHKYCMDRLPLQTSNFKDWKAMVIGFECMEARKCGGGPSRGQTAAKGEKMIVNVSKTKKRTNVISKWPVRKACRVKGLWGRHYLKCKINQFGQTANDWK